MIITCQDAVMVLNHRHFVPGDHVLVKNVPAVCTGGGDNSLFATVKYETIEGERVVVILNTVLEIVVNCGSLSLVNPAPPQEYRHSPWDPTY